MRIYITIIALLLSQSLIAQTTDTTSLTTENVKVIKNYEANIATAIQQEIQVDYKPQKTTTQNYRYTTDSEINLEYEPIDPNIRPKVYKSDEHVDRDIKDATVYGAYGIMNTIKAGGAYHYYIEDWIEAGVRVDHFSTRSPEQIYNRANTYGQVYLSYYLSPRTKIGIEGNGDNLGREIDMAITDRYGKIKYQRLGGALNFSHNSFEKSGFAFRSKLSMDRLQNNYSNAITNPSENQLDLKSNLLKKINDNSNVEVDFGYYNSSQANLVDNQSITDVTVRPRVSYKKSNLKIGIGAEYIGVGEDKFMFPLVDIQINQLFNNLGIRLYTESVYSRTNMHQIYQQNPYYIINETEVLPSYQRSYNLSIMYPYKNWTPSITVSYNDYDNDVFYLNTSVFTYDTESMFMVHTLDRKEISITPSFTYQSESFGIDWRLDYRHFLDDQGDNLIYRPKLSSDLKMHQYVFDDKLRLTQMLSFVGERFSQSEDSLERRLEPFVDFGFKVDYMASDFFSVFAEGVNLLDQDYQYYYNIENLGRQVWGGITLRF